MRTSKQAMEEREEAFLRFLMEHPDARPSGTVVSRAEICASLGISTIQLRTLIARLQRSGDLVIKPRFLSNGGQLENAYRVAKQGRARLGGC